MIPIKQKTSNNSAIWKTILKIVNLVFSKMLHLQVNCVTPNQRQDVFCAYFGTHTRLCHFQGCTRSNPQFLTALPSPILFRLMQVCEFVGSPAVQLLECVLETLTSEPAKRNCEHQQRERFFLSQLIVFLPKFSAVLIQYKLTYIFEDNAAVIHMIIKWRSPTWRHVSRTHRVDLD